MTVNIDIDVEAKDAFAKIWGLKGNLKQLESSFDDFELDVDATLGDNIQELREVLEVLDGGGDAGLLENDMQRARILRSLMDDGLFSDVDLNAGFGGGGGGGDGKGPPVPRRTPMGQSDFGFGDADFFDIPLMGDRSPKRTAAFRNVSNAVSNMEESIGSSLRAMLPSMRQWWAIIAAIIPLLITFAAQALGVAAAMGAVAVAGAAILGLGLVGHGEDMAESFRHAKEEVKQLGEDMFEVFQGPSQLFAGVQAEFFDWAPTQMDGLAQSLEGLIAYEGSLFDMWSGLTGWLADSIRGISANEEAVSQLAFRFGDILGSGIINFFGFLLDEAHENQNMLIELGQIIVMVSKTIYNLSKAVSRLVVMFKPLVAVLLSASKLLNNNYVMGVLAAVSVTYLLTAAFIKAMWAASGLLSMLGILGGGGILAGVIGGIMGAVAGIQILIAAMIEAMGVGAALATTLSYLTMGLFAIGGALGALKMADIMADVGAPDTGGSRSRFPSGRGPGAQGAGGTTIINEGDTNVTVNGDTNRRSLEAIRNVANSETTLGTTRDPTA